LREEFNIKTESPKMQEVVVVHYGEKEVGIVIDRVIRESQVVVKSLGKHFKDQEIISGASIMGDGIVALVLDTNKIIEKYSR
jgi:two-component system chemotaxis sensor kinase CheA